MPGYGSSEFRVLRHAQIISNEASRQLWLGKNCNVHYLILCLMRLFLAVHSYGGCLVLELFFDLSTVGNLSLIMVLSNWLPGWY